MKQKVYLPMLLHASRARYLPVFFFHAGAGIRCVGGLIRRTMDEAITKRRAMSEVILVARPLSVFPLLPSLFDSLSFRSRIPEKC